MDRKARLWAKAVLEEMRSEGQGVPIFLPWIQICKCNEPTKSSTSAPQKLTATLRGLGIERASTVY